MCPAIFQCQAALAIENGHVLTIGGSASNAEINFTGTQSVSGNGELVFGGTNNSDYLISNSAGTVVTLAPGIMALVEQNTYFESNIENQTSIIVSAGKSALPDCNPYQRRHHRHRRGRDLLD